MQVRRETLLFLLLGAFVALSYQSVDLETACSTVKFEEFTASVIMVPKQAVHLEETLEQIVKNTDNLMEIIVVDDHSLLHLPESLGKFSNSEKVVFTRTDSQCDANMARAHGAKVAKGQVLVFLEDDVLVGKDWLNHLSRELLQNYDSITFPQIKESETSTPASIPLLDFGELKVVRTENLDSVWATNFVSTGLPASVLPGETFAITSAWWRQLNEEHPGMSLLDMSVLTWVCGSGIFQATCAETHKSVKQTYSLTEAERNVFKQAWGLVKEGEEIVLSMAEEELASAIRQLQCRSIEWFQDQVNTRFAQLFLNNPKDHSTPVKTRSIETSQNSLVSRMNYFGDGPEAFTHTMEVCVAAQISDTEWVLAKVDFPLGHSYCGVTTFTSPARSWAYAVCPPGLSEYNSSACTVTGTSDDCIEVVLVMDGKDDLLCITGYHELVSVNFPTLLTTICLYSWTNQLHYDPFYGLDVGRGNCYNWTKTVASVGEAICVLQYDIDWQDRFVDRPNSQELMLLGCPCDPNDDNEDWALYNEVGDILLRVSQDAEEVFLCGNIPICSWYDAISQHSFLEEIWWVRESSDVPREALADPSAFLSFVEAKLDSIEALLDEVEATGLELTARGIAF